MGAKDFLVVNLAFAIYLLVAFPLIAQVQVRL
jgi:hypothetical protein